MIIELDEDLKEIIGDCDSEESQIYKLLDKIAIAYRMGFHFIFSKGIVSNRVLSNKVLSKNIEIVKAFQKVKETEPEYGILVKSAPIKIVVTKEKKFKRKEKEASLRISISYDSDDLQNIITSKTSLLFENSEDGAFYVKCIHFFTRKNKWCIKNKYEIMNGGGDTIAKELIRITKNRDKILFCLCDSDMKSPTSAMGDTAKNAKKLFDALSNKEKFFSKLLIDTSYMEIENLIPSDFLCSINPKSKCFFEKFISNNASLYVDLKKGTFSGILLRDDAQCAKCENNPEQYLKFNSTILKQFNDSKIDLIDNSKLKRNIWLKLGQILFYFTCCANPQVA